MRVSQSQWHQSREKGKSQKGEREHGEKSVAVKWNFSSREDLLSRLERQDAGSQVAEEISLSLS